MPRIFRVLITTALSALHFGSVPTDAAAQGTTLVPAGGSGVSSTQSASATATQMQVEWPNCAWGLAKPYPMWGWITVAFLGDRDYGDVSNQSGDMDTSASMTLKGDFLPTQTLYCRAINYAVEAGPIYTPYGTEYTVQHNNPTCDGHPTLNKSPRPTSTYWISEELYNTSGFLASAFQQGAYCWGDIGSHLQYFELSTPPGSEVGVYPLEADPNVWGMYIQGGPSPTGRTIGLNWYHHTTATFDQWAYAAGHELGHAVGFGGDGFGDTIMDEFSGGRVGLIPRTLDKCGAVKAFPVPLL